VTYRAADLFFLTGGIRNGVALLQEVGGQFVDVIGEIHVFGKSVDDAIHLGQRGAGFFAQSANVGAGSGLGLASATPREIGVLAPADVSLLSISSACLASVAKATSFAGAGLEAAGCGWQLL
jgi:hypothetical protein